MMIGFLNRKTSRIENTLELMRLIGVPLLLSDLFMLVKSQP